MSYAASSLGFVEDSLSPILSVIPSPEEMKRRAVDLGYEKAWKLVEPTFQCKTGQWDVAGVLDCDTQRTFFQMGFEQAWAKAHSEWVGGRLEDAPPPNLTDEQIREEIERARSQPGFDKLTAPSSPAETPSKPFPTATVVVSVVAAAAIAAIIWSKP